MSRKMIAVAGAFAMVVVAPTAAQAKSRPNTFRFTGATAPGSINVTCAKGATTGRSATKLKVKATRNIGKNVPADAIGNTLGQSTKLVASYFGGSMTLGRFETFYTLNSKGQFTFPCPMTELNGTSQLVITIQPYRGRNPIGTPAKVGVTLRRVGAAS
jgi:hypothetical protein